MLDGLMSGNPHSIDKRKLADIIPFLEAYIARKQHQIDDILQTVERYEKRRAAEERAYQTMSPLRKLISGKKPDHHLAVEYIHYVRKPMERVKQLRSEMEAAKALLTGDGKNADPSLLPDDLKSELG